MNGRPGERRKYKRHQIDLNVPYAVTRLREAVEGRGIIRDISYGGLSIDILERLRKRAHFIIPIIAEKLGIYVTVAGEIIWIRRQNDVTSYGIRLDWTSNEEAYKEYIGILETIDTAY